MAKACPDELPALLDITQEDAQEYVYQSENMTVTRLMKMLEFFMATETELRWASSPRIVLENTALKCCLRTVEADTAALNDRIAQLEKQIADLNEKLKNGVVAAAPAKKEKAEVKPAPKKEEPPKPKVLTPTGRSTDETWKEAMNQLKKTDPGVHSFLTQGRLLGCDGTHYRWEAAAGMDFFATALNKEDKRKVVCNALTEAAGVESTFEAVTAGSNKPEMNDDSFVSGLEQTFGKANVLVQDEPK